MKGQQSRMNGRGRIDQVFWNSLGSRRSSTEDNEGGFQMRTRLMGCGVVAALCVAALSFISVPAAAQNTAPLGKPSDKTTPRTADGHPNLNGFWNDSGQFHVPDVDGHSITRVDDGSVFFDFAGA